MSRAAQAQRSGFSRLRSLRKSASDNDVITPTSSPDLADDTNNSPTEEELRLEDEHFVDAEIRRYRDAGIIEDEEELDDLDLVQYWQVH